MTNQLNDLPRLLIVGNFLSAAPGTRGICEEQADHFSTMGWSVLTSSHQRKRLARLIDMIHTAWGERGNYDIALVDVFSGLSFVWAEAVCWTLRSARKPYVLVLRGGNLPVFARHWPGRVQRLLNSASAVVTPSEYLIHQLRSYRQDIYLLRNPLSLERYQFRLRANPRANLVWLRAFNAGYRPDVAVKSVALLSTSLPHIHLTMIGPDRGNGSMAEMEQLAGELGVADHVTFLGPIPKAHVPDALAEHDIFLNTTLIESFGVSVMEAAATGLCIVTSNAGELSYLWNHEHDALLVPPGDPDATASAVRRILTEPGLAEFLSRNARAKAEQFDWSGILPRWQDVLIKAAHGGGR
jgi:glycosyltransferase involved in cell wall biosynthesis